MASATSTTSVSAKKLPTVLIMIGMAGSGKTTWMQSLNATLHRRKKSVYCINLDPACLNLPYGAHIDIRKTVNYKGVMSQYELGPNGAIMASLNLFATKFDQVVSLVEKRAQTEQGLDYVLVDTPGQIEAFTWSASGQIITESLASAFPTVVVYVVDTPRTASSPTTFMSNMLYACSIMYKTRLPLVVTFNKDDVASAEPAILWMRDFEEFHDAIRAESSTGYISELTRSMSLVLSEFYDHLNAVSVSAMFAHNDDLFLEAVETARTQYFDTYRKEYERRKAAREAPERERQEQQVNQFLHDHQDSSSSSSCDASASSSASERREGANASTSQEANDAATE
jgi:GPN-loop GTPase